MNAQRGGSSALGLAALVTLLALGLCLWFLSPHPAQQPSPDCQSVTWKQLGGFEYQVHPKPPPLPAEVTRLNRQKVSLQGFMLPVDFHGREVSTFILSRDQNACCFGIMPAFNQWIFVRMAPEHKALVTMDRPVTVWGQLEVGEEKKNGEVVSLYRITAEGAVAANP